MKPHCVMMLTVIKQTLQEAAETSIRTSQEQVPEQVAEPVNLETLLEFCREPRSRTEMQAL